MKLRLADEISDSIDGRATYSCYVAELPVRDEDGTAAWCCPPKRKNMASEYECICKS